MANNPPYVSMTAIQERRMSVEVETKTHDNRPLLGIVIIDGKKKDGYYVWVSDESDDMEKVVIWKKETQQGRFQPTYRVVVGGVKMNVALSCNCEHSTKRRLSAKPCRHRAATERLIQMGKL